MELVIGPKAVTEEIDIHCSFRRRCWVARERKQTACRSAEPDISGCWPADRLRFAGAGAIFARQNCRHLRIFFPVSTVAESDPVIPSHEPDAHASGKKT